MDVFPKFIIETDDELGDCLIIAKCTYHRELATDIKKVKGGGGWRLDEEGNRFTLYGESFDFGRAKIEDIKNCIKAGNVFSNPCLCYPITDKHEFYYDYDGAIINLKE
jgi:hypothetical protein